VPYTCADVSKAERLLGYSSKVPFEEGIRRTVEWYQTAYELPNCPETQTSAMGRVPSLVNLREQPTESN
jgi:UDP-glucuronate 4-epimerase